MLPPFPYKGIFNPVGHTVKADENDKNFQPPQKHACHLHDKRGIVLCRTGNPYVKAYGSQGGGKFKHGLRQAAVCGFRKK